MYCFQHTGSISMQHIYVLYMYIMYSLRYDVPLNTCLLFPVVLLTHRSLGNVPGHLVPLKKLLKSICCQIKLQTVLLHVLQRQHVGLPIFTILHYKQGTERVIVTGGERQRTCVSRQYTVTQSLTQASFFHIYCLNLLLIILIF